MRIYPKVFNQRRKELKNSEYTANNIRSSSVKSQPMTRETKCVHTRQLFMCHLIVVVPEYVQKSYLATKILVRKNYVLVWISFSSVKCSWRFKEYLNLLHILWAKILLDVRCTDANLKTQHFVKLNWWKNYKKGLLTFPFHPHETFRNKISNCTFLRFFAFVGILRRLFTEGRQNEKGSSR